MFVIIGFVVVLVSVFGGFYEAGGPFMVLIQPAEFLIIGGAGLGALLASAPKNVLHQILNKTIGALKGETVSKTTYLSVLKLMYELLYMAQKEGLIALEKHIETPAESAIFSKYADILSQSTLISFMTDTFRMVIIGGIASHDLEALMEGDMDTHHNDIRKPSVILSKIGDTMPGLGIVAAVLGIVLTMGKIDQPPAVLGHSIGAALVGTFLGILLCYGFVGPMAANLAYKAKEEEVSYQVIKLAIVAFVGGSAPQIAVEFGRRAIPGDDKPTFAELEQAVRSAPK